MSGKAARRKGHQWERDVANLLKPIYGHDVGRGYQTRGGTQDAFDVEGAPFAIECKAGKRINALAALKQAEEAAEARKDKRPGMAVCKQDRQEPFAVMRLETLLTLLRREHGEDRGSGPETEQSDN